ncbi:MAG: DUF1292 domain-containing protein [Christensenellales bacterium]
MSDKEKDMINEDDVLTLEFEDGSIECEIMGTFDHDGKEYMALIPLDDSDDIYIYGYKEVASDEEGVEFELIDITDDKLFEDVVKTFDEIMAEDEENEGVMN